MIGKKNIVIIILIALLIFPACTSASKEVPVVDAGPYHFIKIISDSLEIPCDLKGETGELKLDDAVVKSDSYVLDNDAKTLTIHKSYLNTFSVGEYQFEISTAKGVAKFKIDIADASYEPLTKPADAMTSAHSNKLMYVKDLGLSTGARAKVNTLQWQMGGTDLGFPFYDADLGRLLLCFGDSFSIAPMSGFWNNNILLYADNLDFTKNINWKGALPGQTGSSDLLHQITPSANQVNKDAGIVSQGTTTNIPTGAIALNGNYYMFYMEVKQFDEGGIGAAWQVFSNRVMTSTDKGATWTQFEPIKFTQFAAPNFGMVFPLEVGDYVYLFGTQGGRVDCYSFNDEGAVVQNGPGVRFGSGLKLARVKKDKFEDMNEYEYYTGMNEDTPQFMKGAAGLSYIRPGSDGHEKSFVFRYGASELTVFYNDYLGKYVLSYYLSERIVFRTASQPWGPWSDTETIVRSSSYVGVGSLYGGFSNAMMTTHNGQRMYVIISHWKPTYNTRLLEVVFK